MFKNISDYQDLSNYLPIFLSALIVYMLSIVFISYFDKKKKQELKEFYNSFNIGVIFTDLLLIIININRVRFIYPFIFKEYSLITFLLTSGIIQIIYDLLLSDLYNLIPKNSSLYLSFLNEDKKVLKLPVVLTNVITNVSGIFFASYLATFSITSNINLLLSLLSIIPYLIYFIK